LDTTQPPAWGYKRSPGHGNSVNNSEIRGLFNRLGAKISLASVKDGTSNTIMLGEGLPEQHDHLTNAGWWHFNGGAGHTSTIVPINYVSKDTGCSVPARDRANWNVSWGFKSNHSGGCNFAFADGSIRFVGEKIDMKTYQLLGCRNDGQPVQY